MNTKAKVKNYLIMLIFLLALILTIYLIYNDIKTNREISKINKQMKETNEKLKTIRF